MIESLNIRNSKQGTLFQDQRLIVWFSCGAASAVALKLVSHLNPLAVYCDVKKDEHGDNPRFMADVQKWTGIPITIISSEKYSSVDDVFQQRRYMSGPKGAICTTEMKKIPRFKFQQPGDVHIFGFTNDETDRISDFENDNFELNLAWPLVQANMSKADCLQLISDAGIIIPTMYLLGFKNNNCIGCVKSSSARYWNKIRRLFPAVFYKRCQQSRAIGCKLVKWGGQRIFLDELPPEADDNMSEDLSCGPQCKPNQNHE